MFFSIHSNWFTRYLQSEEAMARVRSLIPFKDFDGIIVDLESDVQEYGPTENTKSLKRRLDYVRDGNNKLISDNYRFLEKVGEIKAVVSRQGSKVNEFKVLKRNLESERDEAKG